MLLSHIQQQQSQHSHTNVKDSYTLADLNRHRQKNAAGKIIIVYDEDERIASQAATTMCQRGFENLFMLSGGPFMLVLPHRNKASEKPFEISVKPQTLGECV